VGGAHRAGLLAAVDAGPSDLLGAGLRGAGPGADPLGADRRRRSAVAALAALAWGWRQFRKPTRGEALARLDATLPGRPLSALGDTQVIGTGDPASLAVWRAHLKRMADRAAQAKPVRPTCGCRRATPIRCAMWR
jgi:hypothetical protein